jgi:hypothetical protein
VLASFGVFASCSIVQNDLFADDTVVDASGAVAQPVDVASQALNGAQIASLLEIIVQTTANVLTIPSAKAITKAAFPMLGDAEINNIFDNLSNVVIDPTQVVQKKKVECEHQSISETDAIELDSIAEKLIQLGEDVNEDWILIDEYDVDYDEDDAENEAISHIFDAVEIHQVSTGTAKPNATSEQDATIDERKYYTRYRYSGKITDVTRPFCTKMLQADKLYRKEDILAMTNKAVNPGWGPNGSDFYSAWLYKGGGNCGHVWSKQLYISAKGFGLDLNSPNVRTQAWSKAEKAGYKVRNNYLVEKKPKDMPYNGFLPTNPRFGNK